MSGGQEHTQPSRGRDDHSEVDSAPASGTSEHKEQIDTDVDAILDEIDEVLEENAEEFVSSFVQKGGQ